MSFRLFMILLASIHLSACASCEDGAGVPSQQDMESDVPNNDLGTPDSGLDHGFDLSPSDMTMSPDLADMAGEDSAGDLEEDIAPDMEEVGPRLPLEFVSAHWVKDLRISSTFTVSDGQGGWYAAGSSAGWDVIFDPGLPSELIIDASGSNGFRSIFAHWDANGTLTKAIPFTEYAGGPRSGGTSETRAIGREVDGNLLISGVFYASVRFSNNTVWSTLQGDVGGAISTAGETYVVRMNPTTNELQNLVRVSTSSVTGLVAPIGLVVHPSSSDFAIGGRITNGATFPGGTTLAGTGGFVARFEQDGTLRWAQKIGFDVVSLTTIQDESLLVQFTYDASGFELGGMTYPGSGSNPRGHAVARLNSDGSLVWMVRMEGSSFGFVYWDKEVEGDRVYLALSPGTNQFVELPNAPTISEETRILVLNSATGEVLEAESLAMIPDEVDDVQMLQMDEAGILWTYVSYSVDDEPTTQDYQVSPKFGPQLNLPMGGFYGVLMGLDTADFSIAYAYLASDQGYWHSPKSTRLSDGMLFHHYFFDDVRLGPGSDSPRTFTNDPELNRPDHAFLRVR